MQSIERFAFEFNVHQDYFECHEILEELWQAGNRTDDSLVGLIQLAVAQYHHRRGNEAGAMKTYPKAFQKIRQHAKTIRSYGIDAGLLLEVEREIQERFTPIRLPLLSPVKEGVEQLEKLDLDPHYLMHKHRLRDRTEVIVAREEALGLRETMKDR
ncbi:DUF309 domain-containing protein [Exiguobacterium flavidum]|uniref:DUF309 domain-containing protein n=1 Tax=Exiguobacterium flavidum TaxID=2184695 RepID=UPI000DF7F865|nr:DUF309 domain-containing protein [Exiguobacterium flavidum]